MTLAALSSWALLGQVSSQTGALQGRIEDAQQAPVPNARIVIRHQYTQDQREARTNTTGAFAFANLPIGPYKLQASAPGFAEREIEELLVSVGQTVVQRLELAVEGVAEKLEVVEAADALQAAATNQSLAMGYERMEHSPSAGRNYLNFVLTAPGMAPSPGTSTGRSPAAQWSALNDSGFTFAGLRGRNNAISIDGSDNRDETTGGIRVAVPLEMIQELRIAGTTVAADFGGAAGGLVNIVTRSGGNDWHGHAEFMLQNEALNARNPEFTVPGRPHMRRIQPGGSGSGPLRRDKTFFAAAAEGLREDCDEWSETPFSMLNILGTRAGLFRAGERDQQYSAKLQHIFNPRHSFTARYAYSWGVVNRGVQGIDNAADYSARGSSRLADHSFVASLLSAISPTVVHTITVQFGQRSSLLTPNSRSPQVDIPGFLTFGQAWRLDQDRDERHTQIVDAISITRGAHTLSLGVDLNHVGFDGRLANRFGGITVYPTLEAFLANLPAVRIQAFGEPRTTYSTTPLALWLNDRWQVRPGLTVEAGLRHERQSMPAGLPVSNRNVAPRLGVAWNPARRWVFRAATGLFFDRFPFAFLNDAIQKDGVRAWETYALGNAAPARVSYQASSQLPSTYAAKMTAGFEYLVNRDTTLTAETSFVRGLHLPRIRNAALTLPPRFQLEQTARSRYEGVTVTLHRRMTHEFGYTLAYTGGRARDDGSDFDEQPLDPGNIRRDWAFSRLHQAHRFSASGLFELPLEKLSEKLEHIHFVPTFAYGSGRPFNTLVSSDLYATGAYPLTARPAGIERNTQRLRPTAALDLRAFKEFHPRGERARLQVGTEVFNLLNHANALRALPYARTPDNRAIDGFGRAFDFSNARQIQLFLHFEF